MYARAPALYALQVSNFTTTMLLDQGAISLSKKITGYLDVGQMKVSVDTPPGLIFNVSKAS